MDPVSEPSPAPATAMESSEPPVASAASRDRTGRDMLLALACLLVPILIIGGLLRACGSSDPTVVDTAPAIDNARAADLFPVAVPQGLDEGWQPVQATFRRTDDGTAGTLRLGYLTPSGGQLLLIESSEDAGGLLEHELGEEVDPQGEVTVDGRAWRSSLVRGDERALVDVQDARTIIVVGHAPLEELIALAESLD